MIRKSRRYGEGTWFGVTLPRGGYAVGIITRGTDRTSALFGYFFGPRLPDIPSFESISILKPEDAVVRGRFGDLHLHDGKWPILGRATVWERASWPTPPLVLREDLTGRTYEIIYDDEDPGKELSRTLTNPDNPGPRCGMMGAGAVELVLDHILPEV